MRTNSTTLLEKLGMRHCDAEGPMCLWSPENNKLISGYQRIKKGLKRSDVR